jgi:hypothetical protein
MEKSAKPLGDTASNLAPASDGEGFREMAFSFRAIANVVYDHFH